MILDLPKIIVILGPTASGKTSLAIELAKKFNGEIVSADSRQVYKGMDVGTGKDLKEYQSAKAYHLIDIVSPRTEFSLAKYQKLAYKAIDDILKRGKLPIIAGGSGLYLQAIIDGYELSLAKPDKNLRAKLEQISLEELFKKINKINKKFAQSINESDQKNKRRLIRYLERQITQKQEKGFIDNKKNNNLNYNALIIGISCAKEELHKKIYKRLIERLEKQNMIEEVKELHNAKKITWKRLESFGLEYRYISLFLQEKLSYEEMVNQLFIAIRQFAKRQMSWFRRWENQGAKINWLKNKKEAQDLIKEFL